MGAQLPTPPLARWFADKDLTGKRALVIGCGRGHEARLLAGRGARVVGLDLANDAVIAARALTPPDLAVEFRQGDLFALRGQPAASDLVVEHTCYCAIGIARREEYVDAIADALVPGGEYVALFYAHGRTEGARRLRRTKRICCALGVGSSCSTPRSRPTPSSGARTKESCATTAVANAATPHALLRHLRNLFRRP